ncbi:hypothetical protein HPB50_006563 [Hyalomma asiaticum]|uniref:Uncharacterized protein n=1 Tax=Hyalomma asiaticum TaxID=266040 RepID=A0ACB7RMP8_HYAAI|nr:hypothetical protein HPB50_006563 [Hyalomma asiaticum]
MFMQGGLLYHSELLNERQYRESVVRETRCGEVFAPAHAAPRDEHFSGNEENRVVIYKFNGPLCLATHHNIVADFLDLLMLGEPTIDEGVTKSKDVEEATGKPAAAWAIVMDCSAVGFIDSCGLRALSLVLAAPSRTLRPNFAPFSAPPGLPPARQTSSPPPGLSPFQQASSTTECVSERAGVHRLYNQFRYPASVSRSNRIPLLSRVLKHAAKVEQQ